VFIVGPRGVGKSTFAAALSAELGYGWACGEISAEIIKAKAQMLAQVDELNGYAYGASVDALTFWRETLTEKKDAWRPELIALGNFARSIVADYWIQQVLARPARICVGVRTADEVVARARRGYADFWIRIERPGHTAPPDNYDPELAQWLAGMFVVSASSVEALQAQAHDYASTIRDYFERLQMRRGLGH
jgi:hypothetical protein